MEEIKNMIEWQIIDDKLPHMELHEKGLGLKGFQATLFYFSTFVAMSSMVWAMLISVNVLRAHKISPDKIPNSYVTIAIICICVSLYCLFTFYNLYKSKKMYQKDIVINDGTVDFKEISDSGVKEWKIKIKKFSSVSLFHYEYRRVKSWYIALVHQDKDKLVPLFLADNDGRNISEEDKRELLAKYGSKFGLSTYYYDEKKEEKKE